MRGVVFLSSASVTRIDAFLKRCYRCGLTSTVFNFQELLFKSDKVLFKECKTKLIVLANFYLAVKPMVIS